MQVKSETRPRFITALSLFFLFGIVDAIHNSRGEPAVDSAASRAGSGVGLAAGLEGVR